MSESAAEGRMTAQAYLVMERQAVARSEYLQGVCTALAGASRRHNILAGQLFAAFLHALEGGPCYPYMADMRLHIQAHQHYVYPDVMVVCDEAAYEDEDMAHDATVIVEILSPGTETYDRGVKFHHYQSLPSLRAYILISQDDMLVEIFQRQDENGPWMYQALSQPTDELHIEALAFSYPLATLYNALPDMRIAS